MRTIRFCCGLLIASLSGPLACDGSGSGLENDDSGTASVDCAAGQIVDGNGVCHGVCNSDVDCSDGESCNTVVGFCIAGQGPDNSSTPDCVGDQCPAPSPDPVDCQSDDDCDFGATCQNGNCASVVPDIELPFSFCQSDDDCGLLTSCQFGFCVGCFDDLQCPDGTCIFGACVDEPLGSIVDCLIDGCPAGESCVPTTGECSPTCNDSSDCGAEQSCAPLLNVCIAEFGCEDIGDCQLGQFCVAGLCIGCQDEASCKAGEQCLFGACFPALGLEGSSGLCDSVTCNSDELCDDFDGSCYPSDGTCSGDVDCRPDQSCNFLSVCSGCSDDGDCRDGQQCLLAACVKLPNL